MTAAPCKCLCLQLGCLASETDGLPTRDGGMRFVIHPTTNHPRMSVSMSGKNRRLVTDEPVEFEK